MTFSVFKNINHFAERWKALDLLAIFCAKYLLYFMIVFLFLWAATFHNWQMFLYPLLSGLFATFAINKIIYVFYKEHRPAELKSAKVLITVPKNPSFPSRHAALVFGISSFLFFYNIPLAIIFTVCSCFVGIARVFCGVHWFHDILGGALSGIASTAILYGILNYIK